MRARPSEVLRRGADYLARHGVADARQAAEALLASVLATDRAGLYSRGDGLTIAEAKAFGTALCRRCEGVPTQHLTGRQAFRRLDLTVRRGVFVPRPETEILVEAALGAVSGVDAPIVVDAGTGSGAAALAIKDERPDAVVFATDSSADAVELARENAVGLSLDVEIVEGDLLEALSGDLRGSIDLVVSNPPYVDEAERTSLPPEVTADPERALFGGTSVHERLVAEAPAWLRPGGALVVEIGAGQAEAVTGIFTRGGFDDVKVLPDLARRDRVVLGRLAGDG